MSSPTTQTMAVPPSRLMGLPPELRLLIYEYLLTGRKVKLLCNNPGRGKKLFALCSQKYMSVILDTGAQTRNEAKATFFKLTTFIVWLVDPLTASKTHYAVDVHRVDKVLEHMQNLELLIRPGGHVERPVKRMMNGLMRKTENFGHLTSLYIKVELKVADNQCLDRLSTIDCHGENKLCYTFLDVDWRSQAFAKTEEAEEPFRVLVQTLQLTDVKDRINLKSCRTFRHRAGRTEDLALRIDDNFHGYRLA